MDRDKPIEVSSLTCRFLRLRAASPFLQIMSKGSARARERWAAKPRDARNEGGSPRRKKRDCPHSQTLWNKRWPHSAKYDWLMCEAWQQTVNNRNHWQVDDGWSTAGMFVTFPEKKKTLDREKEKHKKVSSLRVRDVIAQFKCSKPLFTVKERFSSKTVVLL